MAIFYLYMRRSEMNEVLQAKEAKVTKAQYLKLMALGFVNLSLWFPLSIVFVVLNLVKSPIRPYTSAKQVHSHFDQIGFFTIEQLKLSDRVIFELSRWMGPITAIVFFIFFGFHPKVWSNIKADYEAISNWIKIRMLKIAPSQPNCSRQQNEM